MRSGALVISLDLELVWGMRDLIGSDSSFAERIRTERELIPKILDIFEKYDIGATWALVGFLFAENRQVLEAFSPSIKPQYSDEKLNPYMEELGASEEEDFMHYGAELLKRIKSYKRQEIATHTFSHYYCLAKGQTRESFATDLDSAIAIAEDKGVKLRSIVFPRNLHNNAYDDLLALRGVNVYRGNEKHAAYRNGFDPKSFPLRVYKLLDSYINLSGFHLTSWDEVIQESGLCNIPSSRFWREGKKGLGLLDPLKLRRIKRAMVEAARTNQIFHLWWHPYNFAVNPVKSLKELEEVIRLFIKLQRRYGMKSLNMWEAAQLALDAAASVDSYVKEND